MTGSRLSEQIRKHFQWINESLEARSYYSLKPIESLLLRISHLGVTISRSSLPSDEQQLQNGVEDMAQSAGVNLRLLFDLMKANGLKKEYYRHARSWSTNQAQTTG